MAAVEKISVALTPALAAAVREAVAGGDYASTSEVIRDALRRWRQARAERAQAVEDVRRLWREGLASGFGDAADAESIVARGRARLAGQHEPQT
ncbi:MAG: type II toxin-antitoxin system ParD family antitoxin [Alphaproteobacteria bacterium]|nr:type II toxin-antitoxin system ParD family antitoxin [Alphaproteobacteria bacterium]